MCIHQEKGRREHNHEPGHSIVPKRVLNRAVPGPCCAGTCAAKSLQYVPVEGHACVTYFSYYNWILTGHPFSCLCYHHPSILRTVTIVHRAENHGQRTKQCHPILWSWSTLRILGCHGRRRKNTNVHRAAWSNFGTFPANSKRCDPCTKVLPCKSQGSIFAPT